MLVIAQESGARPVVLLNKIDLCDDLDARLADATRVAGDALVLAACALTGRGVKKLAQLIKPGDTAVFIGTSGVGKSSLINRLYGEDIQATVEVRTNDAKGRHTTSWREMIFLPQGGVVIDTPGMREFHIWIASEGSKQAFPEIDALSVRCHFRDCTHTKENQVCGARSARRRHAPARAIRQFPQTPTRNPLPARSRKESRLARPQEERPRSPSRVQPDGLNSPFSDNTGINTVDVCDTGAVIFPS
jgi:ribosome small subunit-dependent GTPase A